MTLEKINSLDESQNFLKDPSETIGKKLLDVLQKWIISEKKKIKEEKEISHHGLLNKPNITDQDKAWMQRSINLLVANKMDTPENRKFLYDAITYTEKYIKIWPTKRSREDIIAKPDNKNIFQYEDTTYFKRTEEMVKEQNNLLAQQGMKIPSAIDYQKSLRALPGRYTQWNWYVWWNILSLIINTSISGLCDSTGLLKDHTTYGYRWTASLSRNANAYSFVFNHIKGIFDTFYKNHALPIRPVFK